MKFNCDVNGGILIISAVRYALERNTYVPTAIQEWVTDHWDDISIQTKVVILKDVFRHLDIELHKGVQWPTDFRSWEKFAVDNLHRLSYNDRDQFVKNNGKYTRVMHSK